MRKYFLYSLPFLLGLTAAAHAADGSELVVVTATRTAQPADRTGESVSVITGEDLKLQQTVSVTDALQLTPASIVVRNGGVGQNATVSLRGAEVGQSLVLIDGVRINDPSSVDNQALLGDVLVNDIDRVEILRGPQSTLYGSTAIGGVVNIITRTGGDRPFDLHASAEGGSFDTYRLNAGANGSYDRVDYGGAVNYLSTGGISAADKADGNPETDGYRNIGATGNVRVHVLEDVSVDLRGYYAAARSDVDGYNAAFSFGDTPQYNKNTLMAGYAGLNADLLGGRFHNRLAVVGSRADRKLFGEFDFAPPFAFLDRETFSAKGGTARVEYQGTFDLDDDNQLTFGAESQRDTYSSAGFGNYPSAPEQGARRTTSGFGQWQATLFDQLTLTAGVRYDGDSQFGGHTSLKFAGAWAVPEWGTVIHANYGDGFKAPSLYELFSQYSNPLTALKPETARGYEVGVKQRFLDDRISASLTWFSRKTKNQIDFFSCPFAPPFPEGCDVRPFGFYYNIGRTRAEGAEVEIAADLFENVTASVNLTDMASEDLELRTDLARRPRITAGGSLFWTPMKDASLGLTITHVGERFDQAGEVQPLEGYTLVNVLGSYPINENVSFFGRVENLFNDRTEPVFAYGAPGRAAYVGIRASL
jgi:vitamin B12 transporter